MVLRSMVGASVKRKEDPSLITGAGKYVGDIKLPGMCHVAFVRSPYAHANIVSIDSSAAAARDGVVAVITGDDMRDAWEVVPVAGGDIALEKYSHLALVGGPRAPCRRGRGGCHRHISRSGGRRGR